MNKRITQLLVLGTLIPITTFASGGDVIDWMLIELLVLLAFVATLFLANINWTGKGLMTLIFLVTQYIIVRLIDDIPYSQSKLRINSISFCVPIIVTFIFYLP